MTQHAASSWYLGLDAEVAGSHGVLVGDRGRALMAMGLLDDAAVQNEERGLTTVTGRWRDHGVTVAAFGMGAPVAAICLHELAALGVVNFVRAGTMLTYGDTQIGDYVVATAALRHESTSASYGAVGDRSHADPDLLRTAADRLPADGVVSGAVASCDGFYTQLTDILGVHPERAALQELWTREAVVGLDMETSAVYGAAAALAVRALSICIASVDGRTHDRMEGQERRKAEHRLLEMAFDVVVSSADEPARSGG